MLHGVISPDTDFDQIQKMATERMTVGRKIVADPRLDFTNDETTSIGQLAMQRYIEGKYLNYLVKESDARVVQEKDTVNSCLTRNAADIAEIIKKYIKIAPNF